jgi:serine/threonine protein kinase
MTFKADLLVQSRDLLCIAPVPCSTRADAIPEFCDLSCPRIDTASAFSDWNTVRHRNPFPVFKRSSSPERVTLDRFIVRLRDYARKSKIYDTCFRIAYSAEDPRTKRSVFIKAMTIAATKDKETRVQFMREVEILASVEHPTLLGLRGFVPLDNVANELPAILTDFMRYGSYDKIMAAERKGNPPSGWDPTSRFIVLYGTAVGMKVLHSKSIIHRHLKPDRIFLDEAFEPHIADFDLLTSDAYLCSDYETMFRITDRFMAPEIYDGKPYEGPVDVYAYGMFMYVATTGLDIFPELWTFYFVQAIMQGKRPPFPDQFDSHWKRLVEDCWQYDSKNRPTFQEIVERLGNTEFVNNQIDGERFRVYQSRILSKPTSKLQFILTSLRMLMLCLSSERAGHSWSITFRRLPN